MLIQVWAGVPAGHVLNAEDPIALIATIKGRPDDSNITKVDVSALARDHISLINDLTGNDINLWAGIYIKFAESYDTPSGSEVIQFVSSYTDDVNELIYGTQAKMPFQNAYGGNMGTWVMNEGDSEQKFLTKFLDAKIWTDRYFDLSVILDDFVRKSYFLMYSEYNKNQELLTDSRITAGTDTGTWYNLVSSTEYFGQTFTFDGPTNIRAFVILIDIVGNPTKPYKLVIDQTFPSSLPWDNADGRIRNFSITLVAGWNIIEIDGNFCEGEYAFYIVPQAGGIVDVNNYYRIGIDNGAPYANGTAIQRSIGTWATLGGTDVTCYLNVDRQYSVNDLDEGVYRIQANDKEFGIAESIKAYIRMLKSHVLNPYFDVSLAPWENTASLGPISWTWGAGGTADANIPGANNTFILAQFGKSFETGKKYHWKIEITAITGLLRFYVRGYDGGWNIIEDTGGVRYSSTVGEMAGSFIAGADYTGIGFAFGAPPGFPSTIEVTRFDVWEVADSGDVDLLINSDCEKQSIYLTWINNLGGWDYWNFTAEKEYGIDIEDSSEFDANIFNDWDDNFINGETVTALETVRARNTRTVRSQFLTRTQADAIANIKTSIRVQQIRDDGTKITVLIDKKGFKIREDQQKLFTIEFSLRYTDLIPVQDA